MKTKTNNKSERKPKEALKQVLRKSLANDI